MMPHRLLYGPSMPSWAVWLVYLFAGAGFVSFAAEGETGGKTTKRVSVQKAFEDDAPHITNETVIQMPSGAQNLAAYAQVFNTILLSFGGTVFYFYQRASEIRRQNAIREEDEYKSEMKNSVERVSSELTETRKDLEKARRELETTNESLTSTQQKLRQSEDNQKELLAKMDEQAHRACPLAATGTCPIDHK